jgi:group I intron endonuclease
MNSGIYKILNVVDGKFYIGSSVSILKRWYQHKRMLNKGTHINTHLQNAWSKHGSGSFIFEVLEYVDSNKLIEREQYWITSLEAIKNGYNICINAYSHLGMKRSEETKEKMRGHVVSSEIRAKISASHKGVKLSPEHCRSISEVQRGKIFSTETRNKIRIALKGRKKPPRSPEHSAKISTSNKGCKDSEETKHNKSIALKKAYAEGRKDCTKFIAMNKARIGRIISKETRCKMSKAAKRRVNTEEGRKNLSNAGKASAAKKKQPLLIKDTTINV